MKWLMGIVFAIVLYMMPISTFVMEQQLQPMITVYVQGEVVEDKEVILERYSTLKDALSQVECTEFADMTLLNPLLVLKDQDVIVVPKKSEIKKISINYASKEELMQIPGIGETKALKIIEYRNAMGLFQSLEDLMNVPGIKEKTFMNLKDYICL